MMEMFVWGFKAFFGGLVIMAGIVTAGGSVFFAGWSLYRLYKYVMD